MLSICGTLMASSRRERAPNMAKLLYGKRRNAPHTTSRAKPTVVGTLLQVPLAELHETTRRALALRQLTRDALTELFKKNRAVNRLDRSEVVLKVLDESHVALTSAQYCVLMAHANDNRDWRTALRYWERACAEKKVNERLHGALLATYRAAGHWRNALQHSEAMMNDKIPMDPHALHTVMNACRRAGASDAARAFYVKVTDAGTVPNSTVYLELLRCLQQARGQNIWRESLRVLHSLEGKVDLTAGLFNATMATMGGSAWRRGVELYHTMKEKSVQPSKETLATLVSLNPNDISHTVHCIAEAHSLGMPVTDAMYRAVIANLFRLGLDHEAVRFAEREYQRGTDDPANPVNSSLALSLAIIDSLLAHARPREALLFFEAFESRLGNVVGSATRGLGAIGLRSQRWIVQGRVAVVDHNVILCPRFESLLSHYDSVLIPFSAVRLLVRRVREIGDTVKGRYTKLALRRLLQAFGGAAPMPGVRVLPLVHQLAAHEYISAGGAAIAPESVEQMRRESTARDLPLLIRRSDGLPSAMEVHTSEEEGKEGKDEKAAAAAAARTVLQQADRVTAPERVLAVAAMLKTLNPDASVHVLSPNALQLRVAQRWNRLRPETQLTAVMYPSELSLKAPAEGSAAVEEKPVAKQFTVVNRTTRPLMIPS